MKKLLALLSLTAMVFIIASCSKDDDPAPSKSELLTRHWIQTDFLASQPGVPPVSIYDMFFEPCDKDNIWEFKADGSYTVVEGASKCDLADPNVVTTGTWQLIENDTKIIIDDASEPEQTLNIVELTSTSLRISGTENINGANVTATAVFAAHQ